MIAYHNDQKIKDAILIQINAHAALDELVKGQYWEDGKGCAVGCTIHSGDHKEYETRFGIPQILAHLEDRIFEGLPNDKAKEWPRRFMEAIRPGTDLSRVGWGFLHWLLTDKTVNPGIDHPLVQDAVSQCADLMFKFFSGETQNAARSAESAAWNAARSARSAARSAESAASAERAANAAWSAESAASAASAAWSAASAASAARAARNAAWSAASAERAAYILMSDKLIGLLEAA